MKKKKREFRNYKYRECDAFAEYLTRQSEQGWHFKGWKMGMIFEKGTPESIHYDVEAFPKGTEMDTRPESDAKEYSEYCEAAGWKFIDSQRKFCVFQKIREDAVPIVTPEERFQNIRKAEWRRGLVDICGTLLITVPYLYNFFVTDFSSMIFNDIIIVIIAIMMLLTINAVINCLRTLRWSLKTKKEIESGFIPVYREKSKKVLYCERLYTLILFIGYAFMIYLAYQNGFRNIILPWILIIGFISLVYYIVIPVLRPARGENWGIQIGTYFIVLILFMTFLVIQDHSKEQFNSRIQDVPLRLSDYMDMNKTPDYTDIGILDGMLGKYLYYYEEYTIDEEITDYIKYEIYQTKYPRILDKIWHDKTDYALKNIKNVKNPWNAVSVCESTEETHIGVKYCVLYYNSVLVLQSNTELDETQIQVICEKLDLN